MPVHVASALYFVLLNFVLNLCFLQLMTAVVIEMYTILSDIRKEEERRARKEKKQSDRVKHLVESLDNTGGGVNQFDLWQNLFIGAWNIKKKDFFCIMTYHLKFPPALQEKKESDTNFEKKEG